MNIIQDNFHFLLQGAGITLKVSILAASFGLVIGSIMSLFRISNNFLLKAISGIYVEVIRGTPLLIQVLYLYFGLYQVGIRLPPLTAGIVALSINSGAYVTEIIRSGIQSIDKGQMEASRSLGMNYLLTMRHVILPQAFRRIIPPMVNELIALIKDSSLLSVIGIVELARVGQLVRAKTYDTFYIMTAVAITYFIMTFSLSNLLGYIERRWQIRD
ncbi:MAG: amino acid ABC transporter permease [Firmicutes bacterium]|jgi:polar amino acid transport system permease protein|nr:amino acid ABC transporter permease [Bacillota bacterium]